MYKKTPLLAAAALVAVLGAGAVGIGTSQAATSLGGMPFQGLRDALVARFDLDPADVDAFFQEQRQVMEEKREDRHVKHLEKLVENGTLTQAQADALKAKKADMEAFHVSLKDMTPEERQAAMKAHQEEMKAWAEQLGLPEGFFRMMGKGKMHGAGSSRHPGMPQEETQS